MSRVRKGDPLTAFEIFTGFWLSLSLCAMLLLIPAALMEAFGTNPNTIKRSVDATLIEAHPYSQSTGKHSSELRWQGRFQLLDGRTIDQPIDGFFYKSFVSKGEQPIKSWVSVNGRQLGVADPTWVQWKEGMFLTSFLGLIGLLIGIMFTCACPNRY
jgi:hypothetical protein